MMLDAALDSGVITKESMPFWRAVALSQEAAEQAEKYEWELYLMRLAGFAPMKQDMGEEE